MATIVYQKLDANREPVIGVLISDIDAVAQAILTRLLLFQGEWWENTLDGLPLWQQILGHPGRSSADKIALLIQQRILGTPYVVSMQKLQAGFDPISRTFSLYAEVQTAFGALTVTNNYPLPNNAGNL